MGVVETNLAAKTRPLLFTKHIPTLRLCSSRSLLDELPVASPGCFNTSLDEQNVSGALLTHIDLMRLTGKLFSAFTLSLTPFAFAECSKARIVASASLVSF